MIYYYHDESLPLFLLNVFAKNEKANLTKAERNEMKSYYPVSSRGTAGGWRNEESSNLKTAQAEWEWPNY